MEAAGKNKSISSLTLTGMKGEFSGKIPINSTPI
jgi:hypothetical protein